MQKDDGRILDIVLAASEIADFIAGKTYDDYLKQPLLRSAVERQVYVIGEAARQLSEPFKTAHPGIPWVSIVGARNILAHEYGRVDHHILWEIATIHAPSLAGYLTPLVPPEIEE